MLFNYYGWHSHLVYGKFTVVFCFIFRRCLEYSPGVAFYRKPGAHTCSRRTRDASRLFCWRHDTLLLPTSRFSPRCLLRNWHLEPSRLVEGGNCWCSLRRRHLWDALPRKCVDQKLSVHLQNTIHRGGCYHFRYSQHSSVGCVLHVPVPLAR